MVLTLKTMKTEHILIIRFSAMGDVAMTVPIVYSLAATYPNIRITVLSRPFARPLFENLAPNIGFMEADLKNEYHGVKGLNKLYRRLIAKNFTAIADLHDVLRTKYLRMRFDLASFNVEHINKHRSGKRQLCAPDNKKKKVQQPTSFDNYCEVFEKLGYPVQPFFRSIFGHSKGNISKLPSPLNTPKNQEQWIGIAPFAAHKGKIYPLEKMEKVMENILENHPERYIYLFGGGKKEKNQFKEWVDKYPRCINVSNHLSGLGEELILMSHLNVMISMDSANMHLASLVGIPVVSVWGATHPFAGFMGWNQSNKNAIQIDLECRPCSIYGNKPCLRGDFACMNKLQPQLIIDRVNAILNQKANEEPA